MSTDAFSLRMLVNTQIKLFFVLLSSPVVVLISVADVPAFHV